MTCAFVRMRLPAMTTPLPLMSEGDCLLHGLAGSGARRVENTLTTEFSTDFEGVTACELWGAQVASGEGDGAGETGSANEISGIAREMRKRKRMVIGLDTSAISFEFIWNEFTNRHSLFPGAARDR